MRSKNFIGALLLTTSLLLPGSQAMATVWTDHYDVSGGYSSAGEGISTITFDDWGYTGPGGRTAKYFLPINGFGFGSIGQLQHVVTLWPDRLTPENPQNILKDLTNSPVYTNANMDGQVNFYYWGYTSPGFDRQSDYSAYKAGDYSASTRPGSRFNNMMIDLDGDYLVYKNDMHFGYYDAFSYVDATGVNAPQNVVTTLSFQPYPVSDAIGWCGSILAPHPAALAVMAGQLTFDFAFDVYNGANHVFMGTQIVPGFEMRSYGTLTVHVWSGTDLQTFSSEAVINNTNPGNKDRWDVDPNYYNLVSFHGGGVLPDGAWVSADSYNPDGTRKLNLDGTWNVTVVPAGTAGAKWSSNAFAGYAFILRADGLRMVDWFDQTVYGPDLCTNKNCDDGNLCTTDSCVGGVCVNKPVACPTGQACVPANGSCAPFDFCAGVVCNDNNACTTDSCDSAIGCVYTPIVCNDNNACTADTCSPATGCVYTPIVCNDNNACTADTCSPASGCVYTPIVVCNDDNACTTDSCDPATGACVYTQVSCDDGNSCTTDSCDIATGTCVHTPTNACGTVDTTNNNFTMSQSNGIAFGGANDVHFTWDGTLKTSVAASGQVSNATLASTCPFFGKIWTAHDVAIYGPGTYTVYAGCPAGSPGCGTGTPITFTVKAGEKGGHMLFDWSVTKNIDVVDIWKQGSYDQGVDPALYPPVAMWTGACGSNPATKVWDWMSYDWDGDGVNGYHMVDGPFFGMNANFNMMGIPTQGNCDDGNVCTTDTYDPATGCVHINNTLPCDDGNACTTGDVCSGGVCAGTPKNCDDGNICTTDSCDTATGCVHTPVACNDNDACTTDSCDPATGCVHTAISCNDNNDNTTDTCDPATGCVHTLINTDITVTPVVVGNGAITPSTAQIMRYNGRPTKFKGKANAGSHLASVTGCNGTLAGATWTTGPVTSSCTVTATFALNTYTVTPTAKANGSMSPNTGQAVDYNSTTSFEVTPDKGYHIKSVRGCNGTLAGTTFTTGPITRNCVVTAGFEINRYTVTATTADANGTISPIKATVKYKGTKVYKVKANTGYHIASVTGVGCDVTLVGTTYTAGPITGDCTVTATFGP